MREGTRTVVIIFEAYFPEMSGKIVGPTFQGLALTFGDYTKQKVDTIKRCYMNQSSEVSDIRAFFRRGQVSRNNGTIQVLSEVRS